DGNEQSLAGMFNDGVGKDIVTHMEYDQYGRQAKEWLPHVPGTGNAGSYRTGDMANETQAYYKATYADDFSGLPTADVNAYSEKEYEASPLNRVLKQAAPGKDWKLASSGNDNTIALNYQANGASEVRYFKVTTTFANNTYTPSLVQSGYYMDGELYKNVTKDENHDGSATKNHTTEEFTNKMGQVVLKRTYDGGVAHDTYYVYDDFGNLTYVLPPKVTTASVSTTELNELCYQYKYDHRNRLVEKKIPGKGWEYIVYNKLDQPIMTQDPNLDAQNKWLFTKYDAFGRVAYTGLSNATTSSRTALQNTVNGLNNHYVTKSSSYIWIAGTRVYYNNGVYPTGISEVHTMNYYDTYEDTDGLSVPATVLGQAKATNTKGLATVSKVRVLGTNDWITTITGYDIKGRPIYTASKNNYLNTTDIVESRLDFTGRVLETKTTHTKGTNPAIVTTDLFDYDAMGRMTSQRQTINGQGQQTIVENGYDELGQLTGKTVGGGLQTVDYNYNVRGWLKRINNTASLGNDLFAFDINYNTADHGGTALYNGNISETEWRTANDNTLRWYHYGYDALNRIKNATASSSDYNLVDVNYDPNGNITLLKREGQGSGLMDDLVYNYHDSGVSNRLQSVSDASGNTDGFNNGANQTTEYTYDTNGNMLRDLNKGINTDIGYNHLNLPTSVTLSGGTISYIYDATGVKLKKTVGSSVTEYAGNYIYENGNLQFFSHAEGYVDVEGGYDYIYQYKDHLGNVRLSYTDNNGTLEIIEENNYYPFGLKHKGYNQSVSPLGNSVAQRWSYLGQEEQSELGLGWLSFRHRNYMPEIGRFFGVDPVAGDYVTISPYQFAHNNPIWKIELEGLEGQETQGFDLVNAPPSGQSGKNPSAHLPLPVGDQSNGISSGNKSTRKLVSIQKFRRGNQVTGYPGQSIDEAVTRGIQLLGSKLSGSNVSRGASENIQLGTNIFMLIASKGRNGKAGTEVLEQLTKTASNKSLAKITLNTSKLSGAGGDLLEGVVKKTNNIGTHLSPNDLKGAVKDILGSPVNINGKTFDHLGEVTDALKGLGKQINKLNKGIGNGSFSDDVLDAAKSLRTQLQNQKDQIQNVLNNARQEASGF
uniref:DUF6443 domain-containing protein n=1 Tax=uncultured Croceitalea sp. TaxID=1798908 RepID=UPI0033055DD0